MCVMCVSSVCQRGKTHMALKQFLVRGERKKRTLALKQVLVGGKTELDVVDDLFSKKKSQCRSVSYPVWAPYADFFV